MMQTKSILTHTFVKSALQTAKLFLEGNGDLAPLLFVDYASGKGDRIRMVMPDTYEQKRDAFTALGEHLRNTDGPISEALLIMEGWFVSGKDAPDVTAMRPSQHPKRQEAIVLVGRNAANSRQTSVVQPFTRNGDNRPEWDKHPIASYNQPVQPGYRAEGLLDYLFPTAKQA